MSMSSPSMSNPPSMSIQPLKDRKPTKSEEILLYTLDEIVEIVTNPEVRGTQDQTVLLYTYFIYTTREELLSVILKRLTDSTTSAGAQIKVLSLLRTWLKTENDFKDIGHDKFEDDEEEIIAKKPYDSGNDNSSYQSALKSLSPTQSTPDPELTSYSSESQAVIENNEEKKDTDLEAIDDENEHEIPNTNNQPTLKRHKIQYSDDLLFLPPYIKLSPFASYFRKLLISNTKHNE
eukprot:142906_1